MKKCKKITALALSLMLTIVAFMALLYNVLAVSIVAFAKTWPIITVTETVNNDNTVNVSISITSDVSAAGTMNIKYDIDKLELISAEQGKVNAQMVNVHPTKNLIVANYLNASGNIKDDTDIVIMKFKLKSNDFSIGDIFFESFEIYNIDSELIADNTTSEIDYKINSDDAPYEVSVNSTVSQQTKAVSSFVDESIITEERSIKNKDNSMSMQSNVSESINSDLSSLESSENNSESSNKSEIDISSDYQEKSNTLLNNDSSLNANGSSKTESQSNMNQVIIIIISALIVALITFLVIKKQKAKK